MRFTHSTVSEAKRLVTNIKRSNGTTWHSKNNTNVLKNTYFGYREEFKKPVKTMPKKVLDWTWDRCEVFLTNDVLVSPYKKKGRRRAVLMEWDRIYRFFRKVRAWILVEEAVFLVEMLFMVEAHFKCRIYNGLSASQQSTRAPEHTWLLKKSTSLEGHRKLAPSKKPPTLSPPAG